MVYDSSRQVCVLFGGLPTTGPMLDDTWEYDGVNWTPMTAAAPPGRMAPAMGYDPTRGVTVLFGGYSQASGFLGDTWEYDGTGWTAIPGPGPSAREGARMVFDPTLGKLLLTGGGTGVPQNNGETWTYEASGWTMILPHDPAMATIYAGLAHDTARGRTVLYRGWGNGIPVGEIWEFDGTAWTQVPTTTGPAIRVSPAFAYDPDRARCVTFGGISSIGCNPSCTWFSDTWEWDGAQWTPRPVSGPSERYAPGAAYDLARRRLVMYGGQSTNPPGINYVETWELPSGVNGFLSHPAPVVVLGGGQTLSLSASAFGPAPLSWQWRRNGTPLSDGGRISGSTTSNLVITGVVPSDSGSYDVQVSGICGTVTSEISSVAVHPVLLTLTQVQGPGAVEIRNISDLPFRAYFSAFSFDPLNATSPGTGPWLGLHISIQTLVTMYLLGAPPFGGLLDATGESDWSLPPGTLSSLAGVSVWGVTYTYDPPTFAATGSSPIAHLLIQ